MAERSLLDTTMLIETIEHGRHTGLLDVENSISIISLYEFIRHKKKMEENKLLLENSFNVISISNPTILKAAEIFLKLKENGITINENDIQIASAAMVNSLRLYTKDKDFLKIKANFEDFKLQFVGD